MRNSPRLLPRRAFDVRPMQLTFPNGEPLYLNPANVVSWCPSPRRGDEVTSILTNAQHSWAVVETLDQVAEEFRAAMEGA